VDARWPSPRAPDWPSRPPAPVREPSGKGCWIKFVYFGYEWEFEKISDGTLQKRRYFRKTWHLVSKILRSNIENTVTYRESFRQFDDCNYYKSDRVQQNDTGEKLPAHDKHSKGRCQRHVLASLSLPRWETRGLVHRPRENWIQKGRYAPSHPIL
jgi:hypothetical protein